MKNGKLRVALVGVSFGAEFIPVSYTHLDVYKRQFEESCP